MKLSLDQTDEESLLRFGQDVVALLRKRDFAAVAKQFDYAFKFERSALEAIETDFYNCLNHFVAPEERPLVGPDSTAVKYFKPNQSNLIALVECFFTIEEQCPILAELIVSASQGDLYITLEQVGLAEP